MTQALNDQFNFDVSNNSWGAIEPFSDNFNNTNLTFAWLGLRNGVEDGRDGKGTVFIFSAGNQAGLGDNTNYHNFQNAREVIAVGFWRRMIQPRDFQHRGKCPCGNLRCRYAHNGPSPAGLGIQ